MKLLTTGEVATRLGVTRKRVQAMIRDERLPAEKRGRDYLIREVDLRLVEDRKPGRPRKATGEKASKRVDKKASKK